MSGPRTLYDKIWRSHIVEEQDDGTVLLYIDCHLLLEVTSPQAFEGLRAAGRRVRRPHATIAVADHNVPTTDRSKGFADTLKKKCPGGGIKIVAKQPGDFNPDQGLKVMENILQAQKKIDAVYTHDDDMAQGVVQAIRNRQRGVETELMYQMLPPD